MAVREARPAHLSSALSHSPALSPSCATHYLPTPRPRAAPPASFPDFISLLSFPPDRASLPTLPRLGISSSPIFVSLPCASPTISGFYSVSCTPWVSCQLPPSPTLCLSLSP